MGPTAASIIERVKEAIGRGKGRFGLGSITAAQAAVVGSSARFSLIVGESNVVRVRQGNREGFIVMIGMNRDHIVELRGQCDEALKTLGEFPS
jgi:hypothetical protein